MAASAVVPLGKAKVENYPLKQAGEQAPIEPVLFHRNRHLCLLIGPLSVIIIS